MGMQQLIYKLNNVINYIHYFKSTFSKISYPCRLIGERIGPSDCEPIIIFRILGKNDHYHLPLNNIFSNKNIIAGFSPKNAMKLGKIAFNNIIDNSNGNKDLKKFINIKEIMLSSTHDIYNVSYHSIFNIAFNDLNNNMFHDLSPHIDSFTSTHKYPFKLVGYKIDNHTKETILIYTIHGQRNGYQKSLKSIINTSAFLEKFHPTEAVKFGFISAGEEFFCKK